MRAQLESYKLPTLGLLPLMDPYRPAVHSIVYSAHILPISFSCVCERRETHTSYRHLTFYMSSSFIHFSTKDCDITHDLLSRNATAAGSIKRVWN